MTVNELVGKIASKVEELANMKLPQLRAEHPDSQETEIPSKNNDKAATEGLTRGRIIADIIVDMFSQEYDSEL